MNPYVLTFRQPEELVEEFRRIGVDRGGMDIMRRKGFGRCVKVTNARNFWANILKQEMLSLGGDVALSRGTLTGKDKTTDCLVLGNTSQIFQLTQKLKKQPFGLAELGKEIKSALDNFERRRVVLRIGKKNLQLGRRTLVMGIINATPDSFSGDGVLGNSPQEIGRVASEMVKNGADILDVGGESSRPGSKRVSAKEELSRIRPVLRSITKRVRVPLSIDTVKSEVASAALDLGASIVNDISALRFDKKMAKLISRYKASVVLMHMQASPTKMQVNPVYKDVIGEVISFLGDAVKRALDAGIDPERIIVDPGIGFGKTLEHNLEILNKLSALKSLGRPILVGLSRKWFIGKILEREVNERVLGTAAAASIAISNGADIVRVHDVGEMKQAALVADAIINRGEIYGG